MWMDNFQTKAISFEISGCICQSAAFAKLLKMETTKLYSKGCPKAKTAQGEVEREGSLTFQPKQIFQMI
jgi:hypothetical protein